MLDRGRQQAGELARSVMPAKMLTSTAFSDDRAVIHSSTRISRAGLPRIWPVRMSQKFSGFAPRAVSSSISIIDRPAPVVTRPISPSGSSST